ncbi:hypothetical protein BC332_30796 [Capsicum chinense]|nr:hypothetical protein BC332_30796 [Capsicum chinense]
MAEIVVVFDFDKTIIDLDSDNWVVDEFCATDIFNELVPTMSRNNVMDTMIKEIHARGKTMIVSDAKLVFVETILKHSGIRDFFLEINTNPSYIDDEGKLRIRPYNNFDHKGNNPCPPNMCKGLIIE